MQKNLDNPYDPLPLLAFHFIKEQDAQVPLDRYDEQVAETVIRVAMTVNPNLRHASFGFDEIRRALLDNKLSPAALIELMKIAGVLRPDIKDLFDEGIEKLGGVQPLDLSAPLPTPATIEIQRVQ